MEILESLFIKPKNEIFARHILATRRRQPSETLDEYLQVLKTLSKDCNFKNMTAAQYCEESIRDAFITGLQSSHIRQRLLENKTLDLKTVFDQACALELAMRSSETYTATQPSVNAAVPTYSDIPQSPTEISQHHSCNGEERPLCEGVSRPANPRGRISAAAWSPSLATVPTIPTSLSKSSTTVCINGLQVKALFDSGSNESFIHPSIVKEAALTVRPSSSTISMATLASSVKICGTCIVNLVYQEQIYKDLSLSVLPGLCADLILGLDFQSQHQSYGGSKPPLSVCSFSKLNMEPPEPFANLTSDCHPIATNSRRYSQEDTEFIDKEVTRLLEEGIIEPSQSPWRAQVVVTKDENHKKRLAIDYSQTINRFTLLDAFPLPNISEMVNEIAKYRVFSTIDLWSAYHPLPLKDEDKPYIAFEARNGLYQFTRLPFGVTNGVACFQREMVKLVEQHTLNGVFPYLDNITICGKDQEDHDENLERFLEAAKCKNVCYNDDKSIFATRCLPLLGYLIEEGNTSQAVQAFESLKKTVEEAVVAAIDDSIPFEVETDASDVALAATLNQKGRPVAFFSRTLQSSEIKHASVEKEAQAIIEAVRHWKHFLTGRHFTLVTDQKSVSYMFDQRHKTKIKNDKIMR
ncbi:Retrovirus-related Pol poly from transposon [Paramuricea clavata]|uniref:RNA-directed DNA polymerase n=1 Tax=Paramuricea clavata TaxID=317549 RepID=A0A7D9DAP1_PARCT|nr:Retrovirus-related Pol poly from transposon [Paramuricea clavata]